VSRSPKENTIAGDSTASRRDGKFGRGMNAGRRDEVAEARAESDHYYCRNLGPIRHAQKRNGRFMPISGKTPEIGVNRPFSSIVVDAIRRRAGCDTANPAELVRLDSSISYSRMTT